MGPSTCSPFAAVSGGQALAQTPVQFDFPFVSWVKRYRVKPEAVVSTVPIFGIVVVDTLIALGFVPEAPRRRSPSRR